MLNQWMQQKPRLLVVVLLLQTFGSAFAQDQIPSSSGIQAMGPSDQRAQIFGDPNFQGGSQSLYHRKANQNITLQIDYVLKKIEFLQDENYRGDKQLKLRKKYQVLGGFCGKEPSGAISDSQEEDLRKCIDQYALLMSFWEAKALAKIGQNNDSVAVLQCKGFDSSGNCVGSARGAEIAIEDPAENRKRTQIPAYSTAKQLGDFAEKKGVTVVTDTANLEWEQKMFEELKPTQDEFIKFQKVATPSGVLEISQRLAHSSASNNEMKRPQIISEGQLNAASALWLRLRTKLKSRFQGEAHQTDLSAVRKAFVEELKQDVPPEKRSIRRYLYDQARGENIDYANESYRQSSALQSNSNNGLGGSSKGRSGLPVVSDKNPALIEQKLQIPERTTPYRGDEQVNIPVQRSGSRQPTENSVTYDPASRPDFKALQEIYDQDD